MLIRAISTFCILTILLCVTFKFFHSVILQHYSTLKPTNPLKPDSNIKDEKYLSFQNTKLPFCKRITKRDDLVFQRNLSKSLLNIHMLEQRYSRDFKINNICSPQDCKPNSKIMVLIPFRNRMKQLVFLLQNLIPFLQKQKIQFKITVLEQNQATTFNRGKLFNVGYNLTMADSIKTGFEYDCLVFHDVDLIPLDERLSYECSGSSVKHLSVKLPFATSFGGVSELPRKSFKHVNGYSNLYWGWGGEDDDLKIRLDKQKIKQERVLTTEKVNWHVVENTKSHQEEGNRENPKRFELKKKALNRWRRDGLSNLRFEVVEKKNNSVFDHFVVNIGDSDCEEFFTTDCVDRTVL